MLKYATLLIAILFSSLSLGQEPKLPEIIANIAEELADDESDPEAASTFSERLYELAENPVRLNSSGEDEISRLFFLSDFQVKAIADYVHSSGRIISVYELVNIPGFDKATADMMIPFITLINNVTKKSDSAGWLNTSLTNLSVRSGDDDSTAPGSPWKLLNKYKFRAAGFSGGFTIEKDPGEKLFTGDPPTSGFSVSPPCI